MMFEKTGARVKFGSLIAQAALLGALLPWAVFVPTVRAGSIIFVTTTVQKVGATGGCSLQEAIYAANFDDNLAIDSTDPDHFITTECVAGAGADTIVLPTGGVFPLNNVLNDAYNYMGPTATPIIFSNITIEGNGARLERPNPSRNFDGVNFRAIAVGTASIDTNPDGAPHIVSGTGNLTIKDAYIKGFTAKGGNGRSGGGGGLGAGGAIYVHAGTLTVERSTFENNGAGGGNGGDLHSSGPGGGGGGLSGDGGRARGNDARPPGGETIGELGSGGGGGGGGARGDGGANGGTSPFLEGWASIVGGGGGGTVQAGGDGFILTLHEFGGFRCGGTNGKFDEDGGGAPCPGGGGGGGGTPAPVTGSFNGDGGNGAYGGGGGGGALHLSNDATFTFSSGGGKGGFGGGGGAASEGDDGGSSVFGGGGGSGTETPGAGGTFGGHGSAYYGGGGAGLGGAIFNHSGTVTVRNSTFAGNYVVRGSAPPVSPASPGAAANGTDAGGALFSVAGSLTVLNSTVSRNESTGDGAGIVVYKPTTGEATSFTLRNSIIASNGVRECFFRNAVTAQGSGNLIVQNFGCPGMAQTADPQLGPLLLNAPGNTPTMEIPLTSPAVDTADPATALSIDQRGVARPRGAGYDIGAFEAPPPDVDPPVVTVAIDASDSQAGTGWYNIASSGTDGALVHVSASDATAVTNITCSDGATEVLNVAADSGSFSVGNGQHSIACLASDGINPAGAAAGSTDMPVVMKVDQTAPTLNPVVTPNPVALGGSASVAANAADTGSGLASSSCGALDTQTPGVKSVTCQAVDVAGNTSNALAGYTVAYRFFGFQQPIPRSAFKGGSSIPVKFQLGYASGARLADADAAALISPTCRVRITLDGILQPGCASYSATTDTFQYDLKTAKSIAIGVHAIGILVLAPNNGVVNTDSTIIVIK